MVKTGAGVTVTARLTEFNKSLSEYAEKYNADLGKLIKWASTGMVGQVQRIAPVDKGRYRAAWLPFLWSLGITAPIEGSDRKAQMEGVRLCKYKYKFKGTTKPFAWAQNNVHYGPYLEYGVRRGKERNKDLSEAFLSSVSKRSAKGHVRQTILQWHRKVKKALREKRF